MPTGFRSGGVAGKHQQVGVVFPSYAALYRIVKGERGIIAAPMCDGEKALCHLINVHWKADGGVQNRTGWSRSRRNCETARRGTLITCPPRRGEQSWGSDGRWLPRVLTGGKRVWPGMNPESLCMMSTVHTAYYNPIIKDTSM
jgi:hypothetical protein